MTPPLRWRRTQRQLCFAFLALVLSRPAVSSTPDEPADYFDLSLEQLADLEVTTVSGVSQGWFTTPAAIYVITSEDLRRSGHTHIAEALRLVPGAYVGRLDSSQWATGIRGFADTFSPYLQVLIDGRVIYNELFGGVYWDVQTPLLEDVERIEVIRGPGATLWGANAVNGVINVITRSSADTQSTYLSGGGGTAERGFAEARHGMSSGTTHARIWARYQQREPTETQSRGDRNDAWSVFRSGFRADGEIGEQTRWTAQAEGYTTPELEQTFPLPMPPGATVNVSGEGLARGGHVLLKLEDDDPDRGAGWSAQSYYDVEHRRNAAGFRSQRGTFDLDLRHRIELDLGMKHDWMWGAGYRYRETDTEPQPNIAIAPADRRTHLATLFLQDTLHLIEDELFLMVGSKFEYNSFTDFEAQPSARLWWTPNERHTVWGAVSRPVRIPDIIRNSIVSTLSLPGVGVPVFLRGPDDLTATRLIAYEAGYRWRPIDDLLFDLTAFYFDYDDLIVILPTPVPTELVFANSGSAQSYGGEFLVDWRVTRNLRLVAAYSWLRVDARDTGLSASGDLDPEHQVQVRGQLDVTRDLELNAALYYVDEIPRYQGVQDPGFEDIDEYVRLDIGVTWRPKRSLELSLWGQNLADASHAESNSTATQEATSRVSRGVYGRIVVDF